MPATPHAVFRNLRDFLDALRRAGDLAVVDAPVEARLEVAEIHRRTIAAGGPALLFTRVRGADHPLVTNLFGTERRAALAFGDAARSFVARAVETLQTAMPPSAAGLWRARDVAQQALKIGLRRRASAPVLQIDEAPRLDRWPVVTCWPQDGGPFITLPLVYTEHPERPGHGHNLGMYRMQVHSPTETGMHWQIGKGGGFHYHAAEERGAALPVTVFLGGPPALILAAVAPLPENVPELLLASLVLGERLGVTRLAGHPHPLVAEAEFALLGTVAPHRRAPEGPFGDHYGYYSLRHDYPVFTAERLLRRRDAIFPATVVGKPRQEDFFVGDLLQELLSPLFPLVMPGVRALWSYGETGYHSLAAAVVRERYGREAMASAFRVLGEGQLSLTKFLLITDSPLDLTDFRSTLEHVLARTRPETDLFVFANTSMDTLDYTGPAVNLGSKGVWLGLGAPVRELPREFRPPAPPPRDAHGITVFSAGCLVVGGPPFAEDAAAAERFAAHPAFAGWPLLVLSDEPERAAKSSMNFLWTTFTRFEPARDVHAARRSIVRNHIAFTPPILIDARRKPGFPDELVCDAETAALVSRRWREYFPAGGVEMGDSDAAHLD